MSCQSPGGRPVTAALSHVGRVRPNQEDSWQIETIENSESGDTPLLLLLVADGIGGGPAGEVASRVAIDTAASVFRREISAPSAEGRGLRSALRTALREAGDEVLAQANAEAAREGMGSTLVAAVLSGDTLILGWMGDSRAYLLRDEILLPLTRDHRGFAMDGNRLRGGFLVRCAGMGGVDPDIRDLPLRPGDRVLLCTDGLNCVDTGELGRLGRVALTVDNWASDLVKMALQRGGPDNVTVVVAEVPALSDSPPVGRLPAAAIHPGARVDALVLRELLHEEEAHAWYLASAGDSVCLNYILKSEKWIDVGLLLEIQMLEESLSRVNDPSVARVEGLDSRKTAPYICLHLSGPVDEPPGGSPAPLSGWHSLQARLSSAGPGDILQGSAGPVSTLSTAAEVARCLEIASSVAGALQAVRLSLLPSGAAHPSDFWGMGNRYQLCRWPSPRRRFVRGDDPEMDPYLPREPPSVPGGLAGPESDAYFVGCVLRQLLAGTPLDGQPKVTRLLESLGDRSPRVRMAALGGLERLRDEAIESANNAATTRPQSQIADMVPGPVTS